MTSPAPDPAHFVSCEFDAAYTRNTTERFDGLTHPPDHDGVETLIDVWAGGYAPGLELVNLTIPDAGVRLDLTPDQAERLGCILIAEAARGRRLAS
jgi:hypothetical protein